MNWTILNVTSPVDLFKNLNIISDNSWATTIIVIVWFSIFAILYKLHNEKALTISFFISLIISILMTWIGLLPSNGGVIAVCLVGFLASFVIKLGGYP